MDRIEGRRTKLRNVLLVGAGLVVIAVTPFRVPLAIRFSLGVLLLCPLLMVGCTAAVTAAATSLRPTTPEPIRMGVPQGADQLVDLCVPGGPG